MKRIYNYILIFALAISVVGCIDNEFDSDIPSAEIGDEVRFGLSLGDIKTRTVYGGEDNGAFPIYWIDGDKVQIYSPQASEGRNDAEYKVVLPSDVVNPNYAKDLVKTGSYGVQWGEGYEYTDSENKKHTGVHDFYSIYPSGQYTFNEDETDGSVWAQDVQISSTQNIDYWGSDFVYAMNNCVMYACTPKVDMNQVANLNYKPLSTVLWFTLTADAQSNTQESLRQGFQILGITLDSNGAPIAGSFDVNVSNGEFVEVNGRDKINTVIYDKSSGQEVTYTLPAGGILSFPMFLAPGEMAIDGWKITISTDQGSFTKTLTTSSELVAGEVHKIVLPTLAPDTKEWDVSEWMTYIPRNVYLSEVSIPGSWNSLNADFQGTGTDLQTQYDNGVRAFHLDTRWSTSQSKNGLGILGLSDVDQSKVYLSVADGGGGFHIRKTNWNLLSDSYGQMMNPNNPSFQARLEEVVKNVKDDEYMIVFCSFAQESFNDVSKTGKTWMQAISDACNAVNNSTDEALSNRIYNATNLSSSTLVGNVLGKVIVIVNCENAIANETLPTNSLCLFVNIPNKLTSDYFPTSNFKSDNLYFSSESSKALDITLAVSQAQVTSSTSASYTHNTRGYYPTFTERTTVVEAILDWSKNNYGHEGYAHNKWIFLGLGGNTANSKSSDGESDTAIDVLNVYSPLIYKRIADMGVNNVPYYPVGIVFLNYTVPDSHTEGDSAETVKSILMLNNKYRLQYDPSKPTDYIGDEGGSGEGEVD